MLPTTKTMYRAQNIASVLRPDRLQEAKRNLVAGTKASGA